MADETTTTGLPGRTLNFNLSDDTLDRIAAGEKDTRLATDTTLGDAFVTGFTDLETSINTKPSKWIFLLGGLFILSIIL